MLPFQRGYVTNVAALMGGYPFVNSEAATLVAAMTVQPDNARKALIDTLVGALKTSGVWATLDVLYVLAAADSQSARLNWKAPGTFTLSPVNAPAFTANSGYTGDGSTSYLNTQYNPSTAAGNYVLDSATLGVYAITDVAENRIDFGGGSNPQAIVNSRRSDLATTSIEINNAAAGTGRFAVASCIGLTAASRTASNLFPVYRDGAALGSGTSVSTTIPNQALAICGNGLASFSTKRISAAFAGASLTAPQHASAYSALNAYLLAVGAI